MEIPKNSVNHPSRRDFIVTTSVLLGSGLVISCKPLEKIKGFFSKEVHEFQPNVYLIVRSDNRIQLLCHRSEMGQGVRTSMPMLLAEELEVDIDKIELIQAVGDVKYGDQNTDGSTSIRINWIPLRQAGASAREMLIQAAANEWKVAPAECEALHGEVVHKKSGKKLSYGELAEAAAKLPIPEKVTLKTPEQFDIVGKTHSSPDLSDIVTGKAGFGIDAKVEGMVYAVLLRSPTLTGKVKSIDNSAALKIPGVLKTVQIAAQAQDINTVESIAVIAQHTHAAIRGAKALKVEWDTGTEPLESEESKKKELSAALEKSGKDYRVQGNVGAAFKKTKKTITGTYFTPYLAHAQMEPLNAVAQIHEGVCRVWAPTQHPQRARAGIAKFLGIDKEKVEINVTLLGGGFGRKSQPDFILEAVAVAKAVGQPVKLTWTRENDIQHCYFHAISMQRIAVGLDEKGNPLAWEHKTAFPSIMKTFMPNALDPNPFEVGQGAVTLPYRIPNIRVAACPVTSQVKIGWLRSVCHIFHSFAINSVLDEVAAEQKVDPVELRLKWLGADQKLALTDPEKAGPYLQDTGRLARVIRRTAELAKWKERRAAGAKMGFASHYSFFSYVAMAVEVELDEYELKIKRVDCVADCGTVVNPDSVLAQLEGAIIFGLSAAVAGEITLKDGAVTQSNFHDYPLIRMAQAPEMHLDVISSAEIPTGIGEPGVPPVAPALTAAIFAASGKRIRELPLTRAGYELA